MLDLPSVDTPLPYDVRTQQHVPGVGRIDLSLDDDGDRLVWVEIKDWAPESGPNQLGKYWDALRAERRPHSSLVYLTRWGEKPDDAPDEVTAWSWDDFGSFVARWLDAQGLGLNERDRWLVQDHLAYLEERGLVMNDSPLSPGFARSLREFDVVAKRLFGLRDAVVLRLAAQGWPAPPAKNHGFGGAHPEDWGAWWVAYMPRPPDRFPPESAFDFGMLNLLEADQRELLVAGLWLGDAWDRDALSTWLTQMVSLDPADGYRFEPPDAHDDIRLCRAVEFDAFASGTLNQQADAIAKMVLATFRLLQDNPPPASLSRGATPS